MKEKENDARRYLVVVAHPDDELLGAGATISKAAERGDDVFVCTLCRTCATRKDDVAAAKDAGYQIVGVKDYTVGDFKCIGLGNEDHWTMVGFVEAAIRKFRPTDVITHHPADVNYDHYITSAVCQEAVRLPQRQTGYSERIRRFSFMEVQSATDFNLNPSWQPFMPNHYVAVSEAHLQKKIAALALYDKVLRPSPFPRCERNIKALAAIRGSESGFENAEAFQTVFSIEE